MMRRLSLLVAFALSVLYVSPVAAQAVSTPRIIQWGVGPRTGPGADTICAYDRAGVCQTVGTLPQSGGPVTFAPAQVPFAIQRTGDSMSGVFSLPTIAALDLTLAGTPNPNALKLADGLAVSFCPALSCINTPGGSSTVTSSFFDHQRASLLLSGTTQDDGHSEEQTLAVTTSIATGYHKPYASSTAYNVGDNVAVGNAVYRACPAGASTVAACPAGSTSTSAGTTASSGVLNGSSYQSRPTSAPFFVTDGSVTWQWVNDAAIDSKVGSYFETQYLPGTGSGWGMAINTHIKTTPLAGMFLPGVEMDYSNDSGTACGLGTTDCTALRLAMGGSQVTEGLQVTGTATGSAYNSIWGIRVNGDNVASQSAIEVDAAAPVGLGFGISGIGGQSHSIATIRDTTASPASVQVEGVTPTAAFNAIGSGNAANTVGSGLHVGGKYQNGIALDGTFNGSQIVGKNFLVDPSGNITGQNITANGNIAMQPNTQVFAGNNGALYINQSSTGNVAIAGGGGATSFGGSASVAGTITTSGNPVLAHVANNNAISVLQPTTYTRFVRDGFATPGDGGMATYTTTSAAPYASGCPQNSGKGDGGSCIGIAGQGSSYIGAALIDPNIPLTNLIFGGPCTGPNGTDDVAIQAAANTGRAFTIKSGASGCGLSNPITLSTLSQNVGGEGRGLTTLFTEPTSAVLNAKGAAFIVTSGEPAPWIHDLTVVNQQPDSSTQAAFGATATGPAYNYPPTIFAQGQPRLRVEHVGLTGCVTCIDARGNTGGAYFDDIQMSAFNYGIRMDGALDSGRMTRIHAYVFNMTTNQQTYLNGNVTWFDMGHIDDLKFTDNLEIYGSAFGLHAASFSGSSGVPTGSISGNDCDTVITCIGISAGTMSYTGGYIVSGQANGHASINTGGHLVITASPQAFNNGGNPPASGSPLSYAFNIVNGAGAVTVMSGLSNVAPQVDMPILAVGQGTAIFNNNRVEDTASSRSNYPLIYVSPMSGSVSARLVSVGNSFLDAPSSGRVAYQVTTDDVHAIGDNSYPGWTNTMPSAGVGTNGSFVGKYNGPYVGWASYTPSATAGSGSFTTLGTVTGKYSVRGTMMSFTVNVPITTNGSAATSVNVTLPFSTPIVSIAGGAETSVGKALKAIASGTTLTITNYDNSYPGANGTNLFVSGTVPIAPTN